MMKRRDFICSAASLLGMARVGMAAEKPCPPSLVNVTGGSTVTSSCVPSIAPRYMQGMSAFQVRNLEAEFLPQNGKRSMWDALPDEWRQLGQPHGADGVFTSWSGGRGDPLGKRLLIHGGGHGDSSNNGLYVFDFSGDVAPAGWSVAPNSLSSRAVVTSSSTVYPDNKPSSIHSYDQQWFDPNLNRFYRFSGSPFMAGAGASVAYYYDFKTLRWNSEESSGAFFSDPGIASLGSTLVGSPDGSVLLYLAATKVPRFVNVMTGAVKPDGQPLSGSEESQFAVAFDTARSNIGMGRCRYIALFNSGAAGPRIKDISIDWAAQTWSATTRVLLGEAASELNSQGACVFYDATRDSFWAFANRASTSTGNVSALYEIQAEDLTVRKWPLNSSTASISSQVNCKGGFNRHVWFPDWRTVATVHKHDVPVSLIRLPDA